MARSIRESADPIIVKDLGRVDYEQTWHAQSDAAALRAANGGPDELWTLTHDSVYTAGRSTKRQDHPNQGIKVVEVDRGGSITWHGPGQLVCYPIVRLAAPIDVVDYVRRLEEAIIACCHELGLTEAGRVHGRTGVWLPMRSVLEPERKIAQIGVRTTRRVTMHGLALNCNNSLEYFRQIVPCGIADADVSNLSNELGREVTPKDVREPLVEKICAALDGELEVSDHWLVNVRYTEG